MLFGYHSDTNVFKIYRSNNIIRILQQRQHLTIGMIYLLIAYFCFCLSPKYRFVLFMLNYCYIIIIIVLLCVPHVYKIYIEVKTIPEHSNSENIRWQVIYISTYWKYLYIFASILLLCFIYTNFLPIVIIIVLQYFHCVYWQEFTQHHNTAAATASEGRYNIYILIVSFIFCSAFFILFTLLYDKISYHSFYLQLLFVNIGHSQNFQQ